MKEFSSSANVSWAQVGVHDAMLCAMTASEAITGSRLDGPVMTLDVRFFSDRTNFSRFWATELIWLATLPNAKDGTPTRTVSNRLDTQARQGARRTSNPFGEDLENALLHSAFDENLKVLDFASIEPKAMPLALVDLHWTVCRVSLSLHLHTTNWARHFFVLGTLTICIFVGIECPTDRLLFVLAKTVVHRSGDLIQLASREPVTPARPAKVHLLPLVLGI
jgi:hypothetical protein